jgi:steroid delta-isomerase-like uncharacterized protein
VRFRRTTGGSLRFLTLLAAAACAPAGQETAANTAEVNKELVRQFAQAINDRNLDALDDLVAPDVVRHSQATPGLEIDSLDDLKAFLAADFGVVPDSRIQMHQLVAEGEHVAFWATYAGTQEGQMGPFPPSGNRVSSDFAGYFRVEQGRIAELWVIWDNVTILTQLGHMPAVQGGDAPIP